MPCRIVLLKVTCWVGWSQHKVCKASVFNGSRSIFVDTFSCCKIGCTVRRAAGASMAMLEKEHLCQLGSTFWARHIILASFWEETKIKSSEIVWLSVQLAPCFSSGFSSLSWRSDLAYVYRVLGLWVQMSTRCCQVWKWGFGVCLEMFIQSEVFVFV